MRNFTAEKGNFVCTPDYNISICKFFFDKLSYYTALF